MTTVAILIFALSHPHVLRDPKQCGQLTQALVEIAVYEANPLSHKSVHYDEDIEAIKKFMNRCAK